MAAEAIDLAPSELEAAFSALEAAQPQRDPFAEATAAAVSAAVAGAVQGVLTATAQQPAAAAPAGAGRLLSAYARYLALFVGAGLIAGAVVHFPLAPVRYTLMGVAGAVVFAIGSIGDDLGRRTAADRTAHLVASLLLALAVGMVAGGIQHFSDVPGRAAVLIPLGLAVGLGAFAVRDGFRLAPRERAVVAGGIVALAVALALVLQGIAGGSGGPAAGHGHGAGHAH